MMIVPRSSGIRFAVHMKRGLLSFQIDNHLSGPVNRQVVAN